eukprot:scaffold230158_cov18-Prasinocladus_malaysianus.AAC.1
MARVPVREDHKSKKWHTKASTVRGSASSPVRVVVPGGEWRAETSIPLLVRVLYEWTSSALLISVATTSSSDTCTRTQMKVAHVMACA